MGGLVEITIRGSFFMEMKNAEYIQSKIGYTFRRVGLLCQAFTRKSYTSENRHAQNNEVLEFYGDRALDFVVAKRMSESYGSVSIGHMFYSKADEGKLTEIKKKLVCREMLAGRIRELGFDYRMLMGKGDIEQRVWEQESVQEDLFEAIVGAVAIDSNWDIEALTKVVDNMLNLTYYLQNGFEDDKDYVALVQQMYQKKHNALPIYDFPKMMSWAVEISPERKGNRECDLYLSEENVRFWGTGKNKVEARIDAAKKAYKYLSDLEQLSSCGALQAIGEPCRESAINQLQELYQKGYIEEPQYVFELGCDSNGYASFVCKCSVVKEGNEHCWGGIASSKKEAKKEAALNVLNSVLGKVEISCQVSGDREMLRRGGWKG